MSERSTSELRPSPKFDRVHRLASRNKPRAIIAKCGDFIPGIENPIIKEEIQKVISNLKI